MFETCKTSVEGSDLAVELSIQHVSLHVGVWCSVCVNAVLEWSGATAVLEAPMYKTCIGCCN